MNPIDQAIYEIIAQTTHTSDQDMIRIVLNNFAKKVRSGECTTESGKKEDLKVFSVRYMNGYTRLFRGMTWCDIINTMYSYGTDVKEIVYLCDDIDMVEGERTSEEE